jgi:hypothetical protein
VLSSSKPQNRLLQVLEKVARILTFRATIAQALATFARFMFQLLSRSTPKIENVPVKGPVAVVPYSSYSFISWARHSSIKPGALTVHSNHHCSVSLPTSGLRVSNATHLKWRCDPRAVSLVASLCLGATFLLVVPSW